MGAKKLLLTRISHKSSTALRNLGTGADFVGFACPCAAQMQATLQGVDPASPAHDSPLHSNFATHGRREAHTSTRSSFARYEFCEKCGLTNQLLSVLVYNELQGSSTPKPSVAKRTLGRNEQ